MNKQERIEYLENQIILCDLMDNPGREEYEQELMELRKQVEV